VVCQRLRFRPDLNLRVPECEILRSTNPVKTFIRNRDFFKLPQALETGADFGMWSFARYQAWMSRRTQWHVPGAEDEAPDEDVAVGNTTPPPGKSATKISSSETRPPDRATDAKPAGPIEIEPVAGGLEELVKRLK
jgi:twitching motility protein PilT